MTKTNQATVSLLDDKNEVTTPDWDRRIDLEISLSCTLLNTADYM